jgi:hypothetical protein
LGRLQLWALNRLVTHYDGMPLQRSERLGDIDFDGVPVVMIDADDHLSVHTH